MRRLFVAIALACLGLLLGAQAASGHAVLRGSDPAGGASLAEAPEKVQIAFTEPPDLTLSSIRVLDAGGNQVERGKARLVPGKPLLLEAPLGQLAKGTYTVAWRVVSRADGHLTTGAFAFGVGVQPNPNAPAQVVGAQAGSDTESPTPLAVAGRWTLDWGLLLLVGAVASGLLVFRRPALPPLPLLVGAFAVAAVGLVASVLAEHLKVDVPFGDLLGSSTGTKLLVQAGALVVTALALLAVVRLPGRRVPLGALGIAAAGTLLAHVAAGHASAEGSLSWLHVLGQWAHVLAVGVWVGGMLWLVLGIRGAGAEQDRVEAVRRFSAMATVALGVVVLTGVIRSLVEVGSWSALTGTSFGRTLLIKGGLVVGLVGIGAVNRFRIVPALRAGRAKLVTVGATVRGELALAIPIVLAAALLGELAPAKTAAEAASARPSVPNVSAVTASGSDFATTVKVELTATPGTVGQNQFVAKVVDYDSGQPVPAERVSLRFALPANPDVGASALDLQRAADGRWQGRGAMLSIGGRWSVTTLVERPGGAVTVPLELETRSAEPEPAPAQPVEVSRAPGQPTVYTITLAQAGKLQAYLDPGRAGGNALHLTWFDPAGDELPIGNARASATPPSGGARTLTLDRLSTGHLTTNLDLNPGRWTFEVDATTKAGVATSARFEQVIEQ